MVNIKSDVIELTLTQVIAMLPADIVEECVMVRGVEKCVSHLQRALVEYKHALCISCPHCKFPNLDDIT